MKRKAKINISPKGKKTTSPKAMNEILELMGLKQIEKKAEINISNNDKKSNLNNQNNKQIIEYEDKDLKERNSENNLKITSINECLD